MSKRKKSDGLVWENVIVPDPARGGKSRKNLAFRCISAVPVTDPDGGIECVLILGGAHDGLQVFPAYGASKRLRAPKGSEEADIPEQGRLC